jgi:hydroxymethylglutaryl-CoA lyase
MKLPKRVKIVEVGPRDGLQNESAVIPTHMKVELCNRLSSAGFANIEAAAFVSSQRVPQMASSAEVLARIERRPGTIYSALTPNMRGFDAAVAAKADEVVISERNIHCTIAQSIERFRPVAKAAREHHIRLRGAISCALGCPYQGEVTPNAVKEVVMRLAELGCDEIDIADTIGVGTPRATQAVMQMAAEVFDVGRLSGHFHDTYGQAIGNIYASMEVGITIFHSSIAGLGGCPFAQGASGNVASEDVLFLMQGLGIQTDVDLAALVETGQWISRHLGRPAASRAGNALYAQSRKLSGP